MSVAVINGRPLSPPSLNACREARLEASLGLKTPSNTSLSIKTSRLLRRRHAGEEASERRKEKKSRVGRSKIHACPIFWFEENARVLPFFEHRSFVLHDVHFASMYFLNPTQYSTLQAGVFGVPRVKH
ncbi:hypothetical protein CDAR_495531 [Caerostris darwini]|uniref:Uncharacterized protein n=1 Tax=Caerostris darwini TaxID=1538125 RepID=A0AAV4S980_9ARAC|nr:hypothetical protein CDAR_495531 [Caerostris darwini]